VPSKNAGVILFNRADYIILPGVGSFGDAMEKIEEKGIEQTLNQKVLNDKIPFLGICLGTPLSEKFKGYRSDNNKQWLTVKQLRKLVKTI